MPTESNVIDPALERRVQAIAQTWQAETADLAYIPYSTDEISVRYRHLAAEALDALTTVEDDGVLAQRGRSIARGLVEMNLLLPEVLERTLTCLGQELAGEFPVERLSYLFAGLSGGFTAEAGRVLLVQQEAIGRAATAALERAQKELESSRDRLSDTNRQLAAQIRERMQAEDGLRAYAERLRGLHETQLAILSAESLPAILDLCIALVDEFLPNLLTVVLTYDFETNQLEILKSNRKELPSGLSRPIMMREAVETLRQGRVYYVDDIDSRPDLWPGTGEARKLGARSFLIVPLFYHSNLIGAVSIWMAEKRDFTPDEIALTREVADSIAVAIQNRRLLAAEQTARERETTLREVSASLIQGHDLDEVLRQILIQLDRVLASRSSAIMLLEDGVLTLASLQGQTITPDQVRELISRRPGSIWSVLETSQPRIINETRGSPDWHVPVGGKHIRSWMGVPLLVKGECIGILTIDRDRPDAFKNQEMGLAMAFANQAAVAIENARLFRRQREYAGELERRVRDRTRALQVLYGITNAAVSKPDMDSLLQRSLELSIDAFTCSTGTIYLIDEEEQDLKLMAAQDIRAPTRPEELDRLAGDDSLLEKALHAGSPSFYRADELATGWLVEGASSLAIAPLRALNRPVGVMALLSDQPDHFTDASMKLLATIADQIAAAVENIELRRLSRQAAVDEERERLAGDLHDIVTQTVYSASLFAEAARESLRAGNPAKAEQHTQTILQRTDQALRELRLLLFELRTETLTRKGLVSALQERLQTVELRAGIEAEVYAPELANLPPAVEDAFYRVALEALNNALRHARARKVEIFVTLEGGELVMVIADDGVGFAQKAKVPGGMGLDGMKKRIAKIGGRLHVLSTPAGGTRISVRAPLDKLAL
jgi:signal transduction histidine kinase